VLPLHVAVLMKEIVSKEYRNRLRGMDHGSEVCSRKSLEQNTIASDNGLSKTTGIVLELPSSSESDIKGYKLTPLRSLGSALSANSSNTQT
jgi:hypothetical protein